MSARARSAPPPPASPIRLALSAGWVRTAACRSAGRRERAGPGRRLAAACAVLCSLLLAACNTGSYPLDVFPEMHFQPVHRPLEPERLAAPDGAVPVTGASPALTYPQAQHLTSPVALTPANAERARELYRVNCAACHGAAGELTWPNRCRHAPLRRPRALRHGACTVLPRRG